MKLVLGAMISATAVIVAISCGGDEKESNSNPAAANCSTGSSWLGGDSGSELMHPGGNCNSCHSSSGEGPIFGIAGTVQGAGTDSMNCNGISGVTITLTGSDGKTQTLETNGAGNFFAAATVSAPFTASVSKEGITMKMTAAQSDFNCANCHSDGANVTNRLYWSK